jgi:hypothetical protein
MEQDYNRIEEILHSLDGAQRAEAGPYFYSRLRGRMEAALPKPLAWRLALALALVAVLNLLTLKAVEQTPADDATAESIASEYSLTLPDSY